MKSEIFHLKIFRVFFRIVFKKDLSVLVCDDGAYGYNCVNNCSGHCLRDSPCNIHTGHCDRGCKPGYTNSNCSKGESTDKSLYLLQINLFLFDNSNAPFTYL